MACCRKVFNPMLMTIIFTWCNIMQQCTITSTMRKVHLFRGHVTYVYWIDTVNMQNKLSTEFS